MVIDGRVETAEDIVRRWVDWIISVSEDMDIPESGATKEMLLQDRDIVIAMISTHDSGYPAVMAMAVHDVVVERKRQVVQEGYTSEHDDAHDSGELAGAGAAYALNAACLLHPFNGTPIDEPPDSLVWEKEAWKPNHGDNPRRDLVKAAALIIAEIERIDRKERRGA